MNFIYCQNHLLSDYSYCYFLNFLNFDHEFHLCEVLKNHRQTQNIKTNYDLYCNGQAGKAEWTFQELPDFWQIEDIWVSLTTSNQKRGSHSDSLFAVYLHATDLNDLPWKTESYNIIGQRYYHTKKLYNQLCFRW